MARNNNEYLYLLILLILQIGLIVYFGYRKDSYFVDEVLTFNLSNGFYLPLLGDASKYFDQWLPGSFFHNALSVTVPFSFGSVFFNQAADVHPPLYYSAIHLICSLTVGEYSKWHGIIPNILFFIITQLFLFHLAKQITQDGRLSFLVCLVYGFSIGAISSCVTIRMYMMLTLFSVLITFLHAWYLKSILGNKEKVIRCLLLIGVSYALGFLVHYYFVIYAFFLSLFTLITVVLFSNLKNAVYYVFSTFVGILTAMLIFPASLTHIIGSGYRGVEAFRNLQTTSLVERIQSFLTIMENETCLLSVVVITVGLVSLSLLLKFFSIDKHQGKTVLRFEMTVKSMTFEIELNFQGIFLLIMVCAVVCTFVLTSKVAAYYVGRYIWNVYPLMVLLSVCFLVYLLDSVFKNRTVGIFSLIFLFVVLNTPKLTTDNINWLHINGNNVNRVLSEIPESPKTFIAIPHEAAWWLLIDLVTYFEKMESIYITTPNNLLNLSLENDNYFLSVSSGVNSDDVKVVFNYMNRCGFKYSKSFHSDWGWKTYVFERQ